MSGPLKTLESLRAQGLLEAQRDLQSYERELNQLREAREQARKRRLAAESALAKVRLQFANASLLADLRWLELNLLGAARDLEQALVQEGGAVRRAAEAEHRLRDAEAKVREQAVARRTVAVVLERERLAVERRAEQRAEEEAEDSFRAGHSVLNATRRP
ncbi:MAG: hypothetical protein QM778_31345 [Myxococcales bacterium]